MRVARGRLDKRNVKELEVLNAPNMHLKEKSPNVNSLEAINMLSQEVTKDVGKRQGLYKKRLTP